MQYWTGSIDRQAAILSAVAIAARLGFHLYTGFTADDAFISFRYAENMAHGLGFVYNEGERVLGTTTPLFTFLLSVFSLVKIPLQPAALFLSLLASGMTAGLLFRLAHRLRFGSFAFVPALAYALWPRCIPADTCGMETALFTLLVVAALYYQFRQQPMYAIGLASLSTLTRPEGGWLLLLVVIETIRNDRAAWLGSVTAPVLLLGPWLLFSLVYFGSIVPHSITAKLALYSRFWSGTFFERLVFVLGLHNPVGWLLPLACGIGVWWLHKKQNYGSMPLMWLAGMMLFYAASGTHLFFWYLAPLYPVYLLLASATLIRLADRFLRAESLHRWAWGVGIASCLVLAFGLYNPARYYKQYQTTLERVHKQVGLYLWEHARETDLVAAEDVGYMGYYSRLRVLDRDGLVSPEAVNYNREGAYLQLLLDYRPDWVVAADPSPISNFVTDPEFTDRFAAQESFAAGGVSYTVYRQRNSQERLDKRPTGG